LNEDDDVARADFVFLHVGLDATTHHLIDADHAPTGEAFGDSCMQLPDTRPPVKASADLLLLAAVSLWGLNYSIVKFGLSEIAPLAFPVFRFGVGGVALLVVLRLREGSVGVRRQDLPLLCLVGFLGVTLSQISFVFALTNTSATDTALLGATAPIVTAMLAAIVGLETSGRRYWISVLAGLVGVVFIVVGGAAGAKLGSNLLGDGFALTNVVVSSASVLPILPLLQRYSAHRILTYQMLIGTAILVPLAIPGLLTQDYAAVTLAGWGALAYAVVFSGILTNLFYFTAVGQVGPSRAAAYLYLQSFLAVLFAVILLGEHLTPLQVLGGLIVIVSISCSRSWAGRRPPSARQTGTPGIPGSAI
jgi:drug/metabolite transporter (DMT)-like permease